MRRPSQIAIVMTLIALQAYANPNGGLANFSVPKIPTVSINQPGPKKDQYGNVIQPEQPPPQPEPANPNPPQPAAADNLTPQQRLMNQILGRTIPLGKVADPVAVFGKGKPGDPNSPSGTGGADAATSSTSSTTPSLTLPGSGGSGTGSGSGTGGAGKSGTGAGSGSGGAGAGSGGGASPNAGGAAGPGIDGGAPINQVGQGGGGGGGGGGRGGGGGGRGGGGPPQRPARKNLQRLDKLWPMCIFVAQDVPLANAQASINGMIRAAARCSVQIIPEIRTASNVPNNAKQLNELQVKGCNAGATSMPRASTTTITSYPLIAAEMCADYSGPDHTLNPKVAGCAQLAKTNRLSPEQKAKLAQSTNGEEKDFATTDVAPSIEGIKGQNATTLGHEALGHSQMGLVNSDQCGGQGSAGLGIGYPQDEEKEVCKGGRTSSDSAWSDIGCKEMYGNAYANESNQMFDWNYDYYQRHQTGRGLYNMQEAKPVYGKLRPPNAPPVARPPNREGPGNRPNAIVTYDNSPRGGDAGNSVGGGQGTPGTTPPGGGHKKGQQGGGPNGGGTTLATGGSGGNAAGGDAVSVTSLRKGQGGGSQGNGGGALVNGGGVTTKIEYDGKAKPGENQPGAIAGAGGKGSKFEYDSSNGGGSSSAAGSGGSGGSAAGDAAGAAGELASATGGVGGGPGGPGGAAGGLTANGRPKGSDETVFDATFFKGVGKGDEDKVSRRGESLRQGTGRVQTNIYQ